MFCFALYGEAVIRAQNGQVISGGRGKPPIVKMYDPENRGTDETIILALLNNPETALASLMPGTGSPYPQSFVLGDARYSYPGKTPSRPESVSFTFISDEGKNKYKGVVGFSISAEGEVVHQGDVTLGQRTFRLNGQQITQQLLTATLPTDTFIRITQAKKVQLKVGSKSFKLNDYQRKAIVALSGTMEPAGK
jgi:hypothetical protein